MKPQQLLLRGLGQLPEGDNNLLFNWKHLDQLLLEEIWAFHWLRSFGHSTQMQMQIPYRVSSDLALAITVLGFREERR